MTTNQSVIKLPAVACSMITMRGWICQSVFADNPGINLKMAVTCSTLTRNLAEVWQGATIPFYSVIQPLDRFKCLNFIKLIMLKLCLIWINLHVYIDHTRGKRRSGKNLWMIISIFRSPLFSWCFIKNHRVYLVEHLQIFKQNLQHSIWNSLYHTLVGHVL